MAVVPLVAIVGVLWAYSALGPERHDFHVTVTLTGDAYIEASGRGDCRGAGAYADVRRGAGLFILDGSGSRIVSSELGSPRYGQAVGSIARGVERGFGQFSCSFAQVIDDVKKTSAYRLMVGSHVGPDRSRDLLSHSDCCEEWLLSTRLGDG